MHKKYILTSLLFTTLMVYSCKTHYPLADKRFTLIQAGTSLERGKNLTYNVCGQCHYNRELGKFVGERMKDLPKFLGKVYSANITTSTTNGVTHLYSDAQLAYVIKTGITRDGKFIPYMIHPTMAEDDVNDIIVFLRSADEAVSPGNITVGNTKSSLLGRLAMHFSGKPQPYIEGIKKPGKDDAIADGRYLVDIMGCFHCHSKSITSLNYTKAEASKGYMQGGMKFKTPEGLKIYASNLTPDKQAGIGKYTKSGFYTALTEGKTPDGRVLHYPMRLFKHLTEQQSADIYAYIQTLPPSNHKVRGK